MNAARIKKLLGSKDVSNTLLAFAVRIGAGIANYLLFTVIARQTSIEVFGEFSIVFSVAMTLGILASFGQQIFLVKEVPKSAELGDRSREKGAYLFSLASTFIVSIVCATGYAVYSLMSKPTGGSYTATIASAAFIVLYAISMMTVGGLRVMQGVLYAIMTRDLIWRVLSIVGVLIVIPLLGRRGDAKAEVGAIMLLLALTLAPIIVDHLVRILRHVRAEFKAVAATIPWREWGQTSLGLTLVLAISSSDLYLYTIFVGHLVGSTEAGAFFASLKSVELLNMFLMSVTLVVAPEISRAVARNDRDGLQLVCNRAIILQGIPCLLATVLVIAAAAGFMWIFDPSFVRYANLLRLLAVGMLLNALSGATVLMLQLIGKHWLQVFLQGGSLLIALLLLPTMVQFLGIYGTAISFILSKLLWNVAAVVTIRRSRGVDPSIFGLLDRQTGGLKGALAAVAGKANTQHG